MIPVHTISEKSQTVPSWKRELAEAISDPAELLRFVGLSDNADKLKQAISAHQLFPVRVPQSYAQRIKHGDRNDPLLLQVLPLGDECTSVTGFSADPVGDMAAQQRQGLLHKYHGRVLLITTGHCAINCRYCFRREYPYETASATQSQWLSAIDYIANDSSISEVILSGGDPLTLSDKRLKKLIQHIELIPHIKRLRIHSRLPVVLPNRITAELIELLSRTRLQSVMVIHSNHAQELNEDVAVALQALQDANIPCLNQTVLLKNINSSLSALTDLSERLFELGVQPYYLHLLDKVNGAAHFDISENEACALMKALRAELPGYLVPKLVKEEAGEANKTAFY